MSGISNCVPCACQGTVHNWSPQPCMHNSFGGIPPTVPCGCSTGSGCGSSIRDMKLACFAKDISEAYHVLTEALVGKTAQLTVLSTQKPLLITALKEHKDYTSDLEEIFERDDTINGILGAIKTSIDLLSADDDYDSYVEKYNVLKKAVDAYFAYANTCG